jgi:hypothetical protein
MLARLLRIIGICETRKKVSNSSSSRIYMSGIVERGYKIPCQ